MECLNSRHRVQDLRIFENSYSTNKIISTSEDDNSHDPKATTSATTLGPDSTVCQQRHRLADLPLDASHAQYCRLSVDPRYPEVHRQL